MNGIPVGWLLPELKPSNHHAIAVEKVHHGGEAAYKANLATVHARRALTRAVDRARSA